MNAAGNKTGVRPVRRSKKRHHSPPVLTLQVFRSVDEVEKIESNWKSLTLACAGPFQTYSWNLAWYQEYTDEYDEILVFVVGFGGKVKSIVPAFRKGDEIRLAGDRICDYQDIIAANQADAVQGLDMTLKWMRRKARNCSFVVGRASSEGWIHSIIQGKLVSSVNFLSFSRYFVPCPLASTNGGLEPFMGALPRKARQDFRRSLNRLDREKPEVGVEILRSGKVDSKTVTELAAFHDRHFRLEGKSPCSDLRLRRVLSTVARDPEVGFQAAKLSSESGEILAMDFGFVRGGRYYGYITAFDLQYRKLAPGKCLLLRRLDTWARDDGVSVIDFLSGDEGYKQGYTQGRQYGVYSHWVMPITVKSRLRHAGLQMRELLRAIKNRARNWFPG